MDRLDLYSSAFWLLFSIYVAIESYHLDLGNWHDPGPGYFPFGAALLFGTMALTVFIKSLKKASGSKGVSGAREKPRWQNVVLVLVAMILYTLFLNTVGFVLCTFLIVVFFVRIVALQRWTKSIMVAFSMAVGSYLLFGCFLKAPLPEGFFFF